jgi:hypothetical protein
MPAPSVAATIIGTFERDPPGCPLWRRLSIRSMHWSTRSPVFSQRWKFRWRASKEGRARVCMSLGRGRGADFG